MRKLHLIAASLAVGFVSGLGAAETGFSGLATFSEQIQEGKVEVGKLYAMDDKKGRFHLIHSEEIDLNCESCHVAKAYAPDYLLVDRANAERNAAGRVRAARPMSWTARCAWGATRPGRGHGLVPDGGPMSGSDSSRQGAGSMLPPPPGSDPKPGGSPAHSASLAPRGREGSGRERAEPEQIKSLAEVRSRTWWLLSRFFLERPEPAFLADSGRPSGSPPASDAAPDPNV